MRIFVYVLIAVVVVLMLLCYSLCAIASEADGKENYDERFDKTE